MRFGSKWFWTLAVVALAAAVGATASTATPSHKAARTITIGVMNPFSGAFALYGEEVTRGYQLAVDAVNAKGGINGQKVVLVRGDALTANQAISEATRLITQEHVQVFTGTYVSGVSNAASQVAAQSNILYWETNALALDLTTRGLPNFIRIGPTAADFAATATKVLAVVAKALGKRVKDLKVYIEHESSIYGSSIGQQQQNSLKYVGADVLGNAAHAAGATDVTDSVLKAKAANPDVWMQTGYVSDTGLLLRTALAQGFRPKAIILTGTGDTRETLEAIGAKDLAGTLVVAYPGPDVAEKYAPGAKAFLAAYRKAYKSDPAAPQSLTAYAGMKVLLDLIKTTKSTDVGKIKAAAAKLNIPLGGLPNGFGVKFDRNFQNVRARLVVIQWRPNGSKVTVFPVAAAGGREVTGLPLK